MAISASIQFTEALGDFFLQLPDHERPYFGLAYGYWLSHYSDSVVPAVSTNNSAPASKTYDSRHPSPHSIPNSDEGQAERKRFYERLSTLKAVWGKPAN